MHLYLPSIFGRVFFKLFQPCGTGFFIYRHFPYFKLVRETINQEIYTTQLFCSVLNYR